MRRRGLANADIRRYREAYRALFFGAGEFRARLEQVAARLCRRRAGAENARLHPRRDTAAHHGRQARRGRRGRMSAAPAASAEGPLALICGGGSLPLAIADSVERARTVGAACSRCMGRPIRPAWRATRTIGSISARAASSNGSRAPPAAATSCSSARWCGRRCGKSVPISRRCWSSRASWRPFAAAMITCYRPLPACSSGMVFACSAHMMSRRKS